MSQQKNKSAVRLTPRLVSRDDAAEYTGVPLTTFKEHVPPRLRVVETGRRVLLDVQQLDKPAEEQRVFAFGGPATPRPPFSDWNGGSPTAAEFSKMRAACFSGERSVRVQ